MAPGGNENGNPRCASVCAAVARYAMLKPSRAVRAAVRRVVFICRRKDESSTSTGLSQPVSELTQTVIPPPPGLAFGEPNDRLQRGIQYAAASRFYRGCSGILDHPLSRVMTAVENPRPKNKSAKPHGRWSARSRSSLRK